MVALRGIDQWPQRHVLACRVAHLQRLRLGHQLLQERLMDASLHQHTAGGHADLALVQVHAPGGVGHGQVEIGIVEDDQRVLATQLQ
ncbi:hypothetical protein D3C73_976330 [compost metagenome]